VCGARHDGELGMRKVTIDLKKMLGLNYVVICTRDKAELECGAVR
jgi:hypothetical protein